MKFSYYNLDKDDPNIKKQSPKEEKIVYNLV